MYTHDKYNLLANDEKEMFFNFFEFNLTNYKRWLSDEKDFTGKAIDRMECYIFDLKHFR